MESMYFFFYSSFCFQYVFTGANREAGFSPWRAIGWFNKAVMIGWRTIQFRTVIWTTPVDHASCAEENDSGLVNVQSTIELGLAIARLPLLHSLR